MSKFNKWEEVQKANHEKMINSLETHEGTDWHKDFQDARRRKKKKKKRSRPRSGSSY